MKVRIKGKRSIIEEIQKSKTTKPEHFIFRIARKIGGKLFKKII